MSPNICSYVLAEEDDAGLESVEVETVVELEERVENSRYEENLLTNN